MGDRSAALGTRLDLPADVLGGRPDAVELLVPASDGASVRDCAVGYDRPVTTLETGRLSDRHPPFRYAALSRVSFSDTDAQGVVYYGRYLPYFDHARLEYHRHLGIEALWQGQHEFVMRALEVEYEAPARFDDLLEVFVRTSRLGRTSVTNELAAYRVMDDVLMCTARLVTVLIDVRSRRPVVLPEAYRAAVAGFEGDSLEVG